MKHTILGAALGLFALAATPAEAQTFQTCAVFTGTHLTGEYCGLVTVTIESETQGFVEIEWGYFGEHAAAETGYDLLHIIMETEQLHIQQIQVSAKQPVFRRHIGGLRRCGFLDGGRRIYSCRHFRWRPFQEFADAAH